MTRADFKSNGRTIQFPTSGHADQCLEFVSRELIPFLSSPNLRVRMLFLSHANETAGMKPDVDAVVAALKQRGDSSVHWFVREYPDETHDTDVLKSFYDGLRMIFRGNAPAF